MASFLGKINRMRNHRLHMANEYIYPSHSMYHEIVQGIPWAGGISLDKPKRLVVQADRFLKYVVKRRPEYKNYPWCPSDTGGVYVHPATWTAERMQSLIEGSKGRMTPAHAFQIADKEMSQKKADVDLQVTLAREHAARLGVYNQGVDGMVKRANKVYESVYKMKDEEAVKTRRKDLQDICRMLIFEGQRMSMHDLYSALPYKDEQIQFFKDFPEYRSLFPPLWWQVDEILEKTRETGFSRRRVPIEREEPENKDDEDVGPPRGFVEDNPTSNAFREWPPEPVFAAENRNRADKKFAEEKTLAEDPELARARREMSEAEEMYRAREALKYRGETDVGGMTEAERTEYIMQRKQMKDAVNRGVKAVSEPKRKEEEEDEEEEGERSTSESAAQETRAAEPETREGESKFFAAYRKFIEEHHLLPVKDRPATFQYAEPEPANLNRQQPIFRRTAAQDLVAQYVKDSASLGKTLDAKALNELKETVREKFGDGAVGEVFSRAENGGGFSIAELEGFGKRSPEEIFWDQIETPRHVNLAADVVLSPFYPENAFPPRGVLADPEVDLSDPERIPEQYKAQYDQLRAYGKKYAHAIEDYAPVKSQEYLEESVEWGKPIAMEHIPDAKDLGPLKITKDLNEVDPAKYLEELGKTIFADEKERKDYEEMLERRYEYIVAKRKERNEQWAQYWPADKPETLIYRGPEVIRERFPEAYKLAVNRQFEELTGVPTKEALESRSYVGLWKTVRQIENRKETRDLSEHEWQNAISFDPSHYKKK